ncbi:MAG: biotin-dependent carboxyltransferase family protein [Ilumatobacteraceae bacterium]
MIEVIAAGPLCTVQDRGRPGFAHLGISRSGAADRPAYELANRLVGNRGGEAALEITFGGLVIRFDDACVVALAGAPCDTIGHDIGDQQPVAVPAGATVTFVAPRSGVRSYLAIRGGVAVESVLGSMSTDVLGGIGPSLLRAGDRLATGLDPGTPFPTQSAPRLPTADDRIRIWPGPRAAWFDPSVVDILVAAPYTVLPSSNRIGARLSGVALDRIVRRELPSEGLVEGAIQVPADGQPLVFLADHPTTGGYPVIAVVDHADLPRIAQARPGDSLRFRWLADATR